jgi:hypothetical protein
MNRKTLAILAGAVLSLTGAGSVDPAFGAVINPNDLMVFQQATTGNAGVNIQMLEVTPSGTLVQTLTDNALYTDNSGSEGDLSFAPGSSGGTVVAFTGFTSTGATETNVAGRGVGILDVNGNFAQSATYSNSATGSQTRGAYSADLNNWYMTDKSGIYYNGGTTALTGSANTRSIKSFGGTTYILQATAGISVVSSLSPSSPSPGITSITSTSLPWSGGANSVSDANAVDFAMLASGQNGSTIDTLYYTDNTGVLKYGLVGGAWTAEGSDTALGTHLSNITAKLDPVSGVDLYLTSDTSSGPGVLEEVTDSAAYNATMNASAANTLYTAGTGDLLRGVSFAPTGVPEPASLGVLALSGGLLLLRRRHLIAT